MINEFPQLETDRLILRQFRDEDAEFILNFRGNPDVARYQLWEPYSTEDVADFLSNYKNILPGTPDTWCGFAIELKEKNIVIGDCALKVFDDERQGEIGFNVSPEYQGKGYAYEAVKMIIDFGFNKLNLHRIISIMDTENLGAIKLSQKLGMRKEAHFIKDVWFKGQWSDEYLFAVLKEEWKK